MSGSVDGNSAWSMSSLRWAGGIQFLSNGVVLSVVSEVNGAYV
jgi:hypothetical protein